MKSKFKITDFSPPPLPKMKKKNRFTIKELLQLQKKKKGKTKILQNVKKKKRIYNSGTFTSTNNAKED